MKRFVSLILILTMAGIAIGRSDWTSRFDAEKMRERVKRLSSDEFEGRGPGTAGAKLATQYIADQLRSSGVAAANKGSYFQNVKLVAAKPDPTSQLLVGKSAETAYKFGDDFVAATGSQSAKAAVDTEIVFVGYGIEAPKYRWNDYKGDPGDYRGKVLMMLVNDPPATADEPDLFAGKALTYYGRWTYKYEEAARRGAAGVILVHTDDSAGYGWNVVRSSNGSWRYEIARAKGEATPFLQFKAWATSDASARMVGQAGLDIADLKEKAKHRDFQPIKTGLRVRLDLRSEIRNLDSPNLVGKVEGSDRTLNSECVVFSAHWDHLGIGEPDACGDRIYNGAYDNASGVAALLGIAEVLASMPQADRPSRSFIFLFPTGEEQGLLGAEYYARHPLVPLDKTAADINVDGVNIFGKVSDFVPLGAERSSLMTAISKVAEERHLRIRGDARPEQGFFFRSDHFPFARVGVPSVSLQHGDTFIKPLGREADAFFKDYNAKYYHQASDEYHDWWDMSAMVQEAEFTLAIGAQVADTPGQPRFKSSDEFFAAEEQRLAR